MVIEKTDLSSKTKRILEVIAYSLGVVIWFVITSLSLAFQQFAWHKIEFGEIASAGNSPALLLEFQKASSLLFWFLVSGGSGLIFVCFICIGLLNFIVEPILFLRDKYFINKY